MSLFWSHLWSLPSAIMRERQPKLRSPDVSPDSRALNGLICAAVVNQKFHDLLLGDPTTALQTGFNGEQFLLTAEEQELVLSIQAASLADFAAQVIGQSTHCQSSREV
jgi:hypothetical protein